MVQDRDHLATTESFAEVGVADVLVQALADQGITSPFPIQALTLAESLGLTVVAEGVETVEQLEYLHQLGADYAQGYLLSKPVDLDEAHLLWHRATLIPGSAF